MCREGVAQVSSRAIGVTKRAAHFVAGGGIFVTDTMGTDDNNFPTDESVSKMIADTKLLFRNADDGDVGYTHTTLVIKQDRISNAALRALTILKNLLVEESSWGNVMLYNSRADTNKGVDAWFELSRDDPGADDLMAVKGLLDAHRCPQFAGSLAFADSKQDNENYHHDEKRAKTLQALLAFIDTRKDPIPEMKMTFIEFWASGGGKRIWKIFTSTFTAKARQQYKNASEFLQQALGFSSMGVTCSACAVCNLEIHDERSLLM
jgi:hypothetical protein